MNIAFRADASRRIGSGHIMRCLTLAESLSALGWEVAFVCRAIEGDLGAYIESKGFPVLRLPALAPGGEGADVPGFQAALAAAWETDAALTVDALRTHRVHPDLLVLDHYSFDRRWELAVSADVACRIMVIDDLANRPHDCSLLLDQNCFPDVHGRYRGLVPARCRLLLGPKYALLRPEFREAREGLRRRVGAVRRILVFFGGVDPANETTKALDAFRSLGLAGMRYDVVVGSQNPNGEAVEARCVELPGAVFHRQVECMARLMAAADLAIGAGGSTTWERCFLGLPCLTVILARNQEETTRCLADRGAIRNLGWNDTLTEADLAAAIRALLDNPAELAAMSQACFDVMAGSTASGVADAIRDVVCRTC